MIYGHGGNIYEAAEAIGCRPEEIFDMSSNINPQGPPPGLAEHLAARISVIERLPEVDAGKAVDAMARFLDCPPSRLLAGNGTTRFIHALPEVLGTRAALILGPTYADYATACRRNKIKPVFHHATEENGFLPDTDRLEPLLEKADTVFICNPNNPTGTLIPAAVILQWAHRYENVRFVVDESYLPFVENGEKESLLRRTADNLIVLHSLSKIFRIPGLRIGFLAASEKWIDTFRNRMLPWSVNAMALEAVLHLTENEEQTRSFIDSSAKKLAMERARFQAQLARETALAPIDSATPFFLARINNGTPPETLCTMLAQERILIRNCSNFEGLSGPWIRISLRTVKENLMAAGILARLVPSGV